MKKPKRKDVKYPALDHRYNLKTRTELIDYDYLHKLTEEQKQFLNKFQEEYVNASLNSKDDSKNIHNTTELRRDCYNRNNARNRCIYTKAKAVNGLIPFDVKLDEEDREKMPEASHNPEEELIEYLDATLPRKVILRVGKPPEEPTE